MEIQKRGPINYASLFVELLVNLAHTRTPNRGRGSLISDKLSLINATVRFAERRCLQHVAVTMGRSRTPTAAKPAPDRERSSNLKLYGTARVFHYLLHTFSRAD